MNHVLQVTDWLSHVPKEVLAKNFRQSISVFDHIPSRQLFIFPSGTYYNTLICPYSSTERQLLAFF